MAIRVRRPTGSLHSSTEVEGSAASSPKEVGLEAEVPPAMASPAPAEGAGTEEDEEMGEGEMPGGHEAEGEADGDGGEASNGEEVMGEGETVEEHPQKARVSDFPSKLLFSLNLFHAWANQVAVGFLRT